MYIFRFVSLIVSLSFSFGFSGFRFLFLSVFIVYFLVYALKKNKAKLILPSFRGFLLPHTPLPSLNV